MLFVKPPTLLVLIPRDQHIPNILLPQKGMIASIRICITLTMIINPHANSVALIVACTVVIFMLMTVRINAHFHHRVTAILLVTITFHLVQSAHMMNPSMVNKGWLLLCIISMQNQESVPDSSGPDHSQWHTNPSNCSDHPAMYHSSNPTNQEVFTSQPQTKIFNYQLILTTTPVKIPMLVKNNLAPHHLHLTVVTKLVQRQNKTVIGTTLKLTTNHLPH